ncbi:hypothetical protein SAMN05421788_106241 [Filimonas lacunae]|uniref:Uncharacterized protein n=2 Tax=Filimonas lacunae TaxID=477680 RepID=A0A173MFA7_9BACT|nr:hypothetical protein FLA_2192 [Filimonas lacunae]SIT25107.1 hypothetical protein SAMN05421788_106241 [Filimonas lacunae]
MLLFEHKRFDECYIALAVDQSKNIDSSYLVPEDLYEELIRQQKNQPGL